MVGATYVLGGYPPLHLPRSAFGVVDNQDHPSHKHLVHSMAAIWIWLEFSESITMLETWPSACDAEGSRGPLNLSLMSSSWHCMYIVCDVFYGKGEVFILEAALGFLLLWETPWPRQLLKRKTLNLTGADLQFRGVVHYHHNRKHGSIETDVVLER